LKEPEELKVSLMQCCVLKQAGPKQLTKHCQEEDSSSLILELLQEKHGVLEGMLTSGGAKNGKWAQAYQLYMVLINMVESDTQFTEFQECLAMAVALEHAEHVQLFDKDAFVDPIARFEHYVEANKRCELDPVFGHFSTWELCLIVNCDTRDDQLEWAHDRPDQVGMKDMMCFCSVPVKSNVGYCQANWPIRPKTYQIMLVSNGGKCGPHAWYGRYICKTFQRGEPSNQNMPQ
jgi:hypothetical protein